MRKIFFPIIALLACMFASCSEEIDYTLDNNCIITSFSLGQVKRTMHTLDKDGKDSTYIINYAGTICPMTIDQINNKIYNKDSLPYGSDPSSILATISSVGSVAYCKAGEPMPEWTIYSSSDSIDFSQPLKFRVMSSDGKAYREYEMKLNIHKQEGEEFVWQKMEGTAPFEDMDQTKALFWKDQVFVLSRKQGVIYASFWNGQEWTQAETDGCELAEIRSLTSIGQKLYLNTSSGKILISEDGIHWTANQSNQTIDHLITYGEGKLFALANESIVYSTDGGQNWNPDLIDSNPNLLPTQDIAGLYYKLNNGNSQLVMIGNRAPEDYSQDTTAMVWSKLFLAQDPENHPWMYYTTNGGHPYTCPNLEDLTLIRYNNSIIALGGKPISGQYRLAYDRLYISSDNGITWKQDDEIVMPYAIKGTTQCVAATVDSNQFLWLICGSEVWKGRLNELGFE